MSAVPYITEADARQAYELADFEHERAALVDGVDALTEQFMAQEVERLRQRWLAVVSQQPDRTPFAGRRA